MARFFRSGYQANLIDAWLPALDGGFATLRGATETPFSLVLEAHA